MYVYIKSEPSLWTVGFFEPDGTWQPDKDFPSPEEAADRVHYLNGDRGPAPRPTPLEQEPTHEELEADFMPPDIPEYEDDGPEEVLWLCLRSSKGKMFRVPDSWRKELLGRLDRVCFGEEEVNGHRVPAAFSGSYSVVPIRLVPDWQSLPVYKGEEEE